MAHKKVHPAESKAPPSDHEHSVNPPGPAQQPTSPAGQQQDPKRRIGSFEGAGGHARQQQMGNKD
jgi:hypothetical protein